MTSRRMDSLFVLALAAATCTLAIAQDAAGAQPALPDRAQRDALATVEANRPRVVERMVDAHGAAMLAHGVPLDAFRAALWALPADRLLAAAFADSAEEVNTIVALEHAREVQPKDGPGSGPNSWIGYTGGGNVASGNGSAVAAGKSNVATGTNAFVGAGTFNLAGGSASFVGAGTSNAASGTSSMVLGGFDNRATVIDATVVSGAGNRATGARSVVVGGGYNVASGQWSFVGGGGRQTGAGAAGSNAQDNVASGDFSIVVGGQGNRAGDLADTVSGGLFNVADGQASTVAGGGYTGTCGYGPIDDTCSNRANGLGSAVGGGIGNRSAGSSAVIAGGFLNTALQSGSTVAGGLGNAAAGITSMVPGGDLNEASGRGSFAAGHRAKATTDGSFMWADLREFDFAPTVPNFFGIRATGGVNFTVAVDAVSGAATQFCNLVPGVPSWQCTSDRNAKENFVAVDGEDVLARLAAMPLYYWNFKGTDPAIRALGPTAQDFRAAFGLGNDDKSIAGANVEGVALAAIQGLKRQLDARDAAIERLQRRLEALERALIQSGVDARQAPTGR